MKTIGLDLDNTVFNSEPLYKMGFKRFDRIYKYTPPKDWDLFKCYPSPVVYDILDLFNSDVVYKMPLLNKKYPEVIQNWQHKYDVKVLTSRKSEKTDAYFFGDIYRKKVSWVRLKTYEQIWNNGMYVPMDNIIQTNTYDKIDEIEKHNIDLVIDDGPKVIEGCLKNGVDCIMVSTAKTPYNHYLRNKVKWVKNLFEIKQL